jgi:hypothetical protein
MVGRESLTFSFNSQGRGRDDYANQTIQQHGPCHSAFALGARNASSTRDSSNQEDFMMMMVCRTSTVSS